MQRTLNELTTTLLLSFCTQTGFLDVCIGIVVFKNCEAIVEIRERKKRNAIKAKTNFFVIQFKTQQKKNSSTKKKEAIFFFQRFELEFRWLRIIYESLLMKKKRFFFVYISSSTASRAWSIRWGRLEEVRAPHWNWKHSDQTPIRWISFIWLDREKVY